MHIKNKLQNVQIKSSHHHNNNNNNENKNKLLTENKTRILHRVTHAICTLWLHTAHIS